jgi:hypothetical protein
VAFKYLPPFLARVPYRNSMYLTRWLCVVPAWKFSSYGSPGTAAAARTIASRGDRLALHQRDAMGAGLIWLHCGSSDQKGSVTMSGPVRYSLLTDAALCSFAQRGDVRATTTLLARHDKWIRRCAGSWRVPGCDQDDVYAIGLHGAVKAARTFDPARRVRFVTFLWYCVRTECAHARVYVNRVSRGGGVTVLSLDDTW